MWQNIVACFAARTTQRLDASTVQAATNGNALNDARTANIRKEWRRIDSENGQVGKGAGNKTATGPASFDSVLTDPVLTVHAPS